MSADANRKPDPVHEEEREEGKHSTSQGPLQGALTEHIRKKCANQDAERRQNPGEPVLGNDCRVRVLDFEGSD